MKRPILSIAMGALTLMGTMHSLKANAEVDPNFYVYLCFGQSNMEGNAQWESIDNSVDSRFKMLATCNFSSPSRTLGTWYVAKCPIVSPVGKLGPTDYFGRTMVAALPADVKVGVVAVAMGGSPIEMFDKDKYQQKLAQNPNEWWAQIAKNYYGGNPYGRLIDMAKKAQKTGVIKGILLHQGCSNNGDPNWPNMVKKIYNDMLTDLGLAADTVPLFVGETLRQENGGSCYGHNVQVDRMPSVVPTSHVISSEGLPGNGQDPWHFSALGYRILGKRYAFAALELMGKELLCDTAYTLTYSYKNFYLAKSVDMEVPESMSAMPGQHIGHNISATATFKDNHKEDVSKSLIFNSEDLVVNNGVLSPKYEGSGAVEVVYMDFLRNDLRKDTTMLDVKFFPFKKECLTILKGSPSFNEADSTFALKASSQIGWCYDNGADMSDYNYLVIKLKQPEKVGCNIRIFSQNDVSSSSYYVKSVNKDSLVVIDLNNMVRSNRRISPSHIGIVSFFSTTVLNIKVEDIYLTNDDPTATGISTVRSHAVTSRQIYDLQGRPMMQGNSLRKGIYLQNGKKILIK